MFIFILKLIFAIKPGTYRLNWEQEGKLVVGNDDSIEIQFNEEENTESEKDDKSDYNNNLVTISGRRLQSISFNNRILCPSKGLLVLCPYDFHLFRIRKMKSEDTTENDVKYEIKHRKKCLEVENSKLVMGQCGDGRWKFDIVDGTGSTLNKNEFSNDPTKPTFNRTTINFEVPQIKDVVYYNPKLRAGNKNKGTESLNRKITQTEISLASENIVPVGINDSITDFNTQSVEFLESLKETFRNKEEKILQEVLGETEGDEKIKQKITDKNEEFSRQNNINKSKKVQNLEGNYQDRKSIKANRFKKKSKTMKIQKRVKRNTRNSQSNLERRERSLIKTRKRKFNKMLTKLKESTDSSQELKKSHSKSKMKKKSNKEFITNSKEDDLNIDSKTDSYDRAYNNHLNKQLDEELKGSQNTDSNKTLSTRYVYYIDRLDSPMKQTPVLSDAKSQPQIIVEEKNKNGIKTNCNMIVGSI